MQDYSGLSKQQVIFSLFPSAEVQLRVSERLEDFSKAQLNGF